MFLLDSLMIAGIRWALETTITAAEAEMNDDTALREQLLAAELQREMGEISDDDFAEIEADLLARIREIKERREGGSGAFGFGGAEPIAADGGSRFQVEASVSGDFYNAADAPHTTVIESEPVEHALGNLVEMSSGETIEVQDMDKASGSERSERSARSARSERSVRSVRSSRQTARTRTRTPRTDRTPRTTRTTRTKK
jgi:hypothetical protein